MRVLVCGGRDYDDERRLNEILDKIHLTTPITVLCQGGARGADLLGKEWAVSREVPNVEYPADWATHGRRAGPIRNHTMLTQFRPDLVVAFAGGRGTAHMVGISHKAGVDTFIVPAFIAEVVPDLSSDWVVR